MDLHRLLADSELEGNLLVEKAKRHQVDHLPLSGREPRDSCGRIGLCASLLTGLYRTRQRAADGIEQL